jgi:hypothetical protein
VFYAAPSRTAKGDVLRWFAEYESEDGTWEAIDPTVGLVHPARNSFTVLSILPLSEEKTKPSWLVRSVVANVRVLEAFPETSGGRVMSAGFVRSKQVVDQARLGQSAWFDENAFNDSLINGPVAFALYLTRATP